MSKKVTMQDIADKLNISKNSVSQALRGKEGVSEETRRLVIKTAKEMGYTYVGQQKSNPQPKRTGSIGLIASDVAFSLKNFFGEIFLSIEREVAAKGKYLHIQSINKEQKEKLILPPFIEQKKVDGILIISHISNKYIQKVLDTGIPTVLVDHHHPNLEADAILTNNRFGAYLAVQHLIELGHRDIAFVGKIDYSPSYEERYEGYLLALKEYGIEPREEFIFQNAIEEEEKVAGYVRSLKNQPTAWFCVNDGFGFFVLSALKQLGMEIPKDVSVCSYDNGQLSQLSSPKTTTVDIDLNLYGKRAVDMLFWRMENPNEPIQELLLTSKLIVRESTGIAPGFGKTE
ncbi:substrate-binding domain-containing protein [Fervidibacillus halotolerans]|uniref:Substrate-binding domain-containing protein n=1 Tax=Fervidibacillus halotolerans TaxID=2980027 RepID=A0A9E8M2A5_9BACI|nr:substrate-binding domain-containing protein [Fervidibacillus halotolerans]WAA13166.1 substrate-binding domain-containing protein [Fervidibacillus halotolerans]